MATRYVFVTGGVISSLGKGIFAASLGNILKNRGLRVSIQKLDPYINIDPGTMSPFQHGEVFVTDDGAETDLDIGHYERFLDQNLSRINSVTAGQIYWSILTKERRGDYLGATVQVIPHVTDEIKRSIKRVARREEIDLLIVEVGGTVGDIESLPFIEAIRQMAADVGRENVMYIHLTLLPYVETTGEPKTKPTQHSVKELLSFGIQPDMIVCRSSRSLTGDVRDKIALFCNVSPSRVIEARTRRFLYEVPLALEKENTSQLVADHLGLDLPQPRPNEFGNLMERLEAPSQGSVTIGVVGKYVRLKDAYLSIHESLTHAGIATESKVDIVYVNSEDVDHELDLSLLDGIIVPGGFGERGIEGKVETIRRIRTSGVPFLGICLGMQCAVIEYARNVCGIERANSSEFEPEGPYSVIDYLADQRNIDEKGGTMRLGLYPARLLPGSKAHETYGGVELIYERHRHRYEFNPEFRGTLEAAGMLCSGVSPDDRLVEIVEIPDHPWFLGVQFHPELRSRPIRAHPLFAGFIAAALRHRNLRSEGPAVPPNPTAKEEDSAGRAAEEAAS